MAVAGVAAVMGATVYTTGALCNVFNHDVVSKNRKQYASYYADLVCRNSHGLRQCGYDDSIGTLATPFACSICRRFVALKTSDTMTCDCPDFFACSECAAECLKQKEAHEQREQARKKKQDSIEREAKMKTEKDEKKKKKAADEKKRSEDEKKRSEEALKQISNLTQTMNRAMKDIDDKVELHIKEMGRETKTVKDDYKRAKMKHEGKREQPKAKREVERERKQPKEQGYDKWSEDTAKATARSIKDQETAQKQVIEYFEKTVPKMQEELNRAAKAAEVKRKQDEEALENERKKIQERQREIDRRQEQRIKIISDYEAELLALKRRIADDKGKIVIPREKQAQLIKLQQEVQILEETALAKKKAYDEAKIQYDLKWTNRSKTETLPGQSFERNTPQIPEINIMEKKDGCIVG